MSAGASPACPIALTAIAAATQAIHAALVFLVTDRPFLRYLPRVSSTRLSSRLAEFTSSDFGAAAI